MTLPTARSSPAPTSGGTLAPSTSGWIAPIAQSQFGIAIRPRLVEVNELRLLVMVAAAGVVASILPGLRAYQMSLSDGLTPRS